MIRLASLFWLALVLVSGFAMFKVKYAVQDLDDELGRVRKHTAAEQQEIRVLNAEWSYLTQPERLADLNRKFLSLAPIPTKQLQQNIDAIPLRPPPPPSLPVEVAAAAPASEPAPAAETTGAAAEVARAAPADSTRPATSLDELIAAVLPSANAADWPAAARPPHGTGSDTVALDAVAPDSVSPGQRPPLPAKVATLKPEAPVRLMKASATGRPHTLNDLLAQIDGVR